MRLLLPPLVVLLLLFVLCFGCVFCFVFFFSFIPCCVSLFRLASSPLQQRKKPKKKKKKKPTHTHTKKENPKPPPPPPPLPPHQVQITEAALPTVTDSEKLIFLYKLCFDFFFSCCFCCSFLLLASLFVYFPFPHCLSLFFFLSALKRECQIKEIR